MLKHVLVDKNNIYLATNIQNTIFPHYSAYQNYYEAVNHFTKNDYFILYDDDTPIGVSGLYEVDDDKTSAWLGWFGILKEYRRNHFGSIALQLFEDEAKKRGYIYTRIYTDRYDNDVALAFYEHNGYSQEEYNNDIDEATKKYPIYIYSKPIGDVPLTLWNNRNIGLTAQIEKQDNFTVVTLTEDKLNSLLHLYEECFLTDHYFLDFFKGKDLKDIMECSFKEMFAYIISKENAFGIFQKGKLIAFILSFDYFDMLKNNKKELNNIFTSDKNNDNYLYQKELHEKILSLEKDVMYMLAIAVKKEEREKGIATVLFNYFLNRYQNKTIVSDVSNGNSLGIYQKNGFEITKIDEDYYLVMKKQTGK